MAYGYCNLRGLWIFMPSMRGFNRGRKGEPKTNSINTRLVKNRDRRRRSRPPMASAE